ncbi:MAG TPA: NifU family protein [Candidatus Onthovivens sp.]|nr:NifU family protein [Candidatus Onthovivens sp.]
MENNETIELIKTTLKKITPFLERDGGGVEFDSFEDGIVYINMQGACDGCLMAGEDIENGIEIILMEEVPGVIAVRLASEKNLIKKEIEKNSLKD